MENYHDYGYTQDGKVYLKGYGDKPDREIGVVKESEEASLQYFADRYAHISQKITDMEEAIQEAQNKGSYLMKLIHLRESLQTYNALGDFPALFDRLDKMEAFINDYIEQNRVKNLEIKKALLEEARQLTASEDWEETAEQLKDLKMRWIRTGSTHEEEELCQEFDQMLDDFFERRKTYYENLKQLTDERMGQYRNLIRALKDINNKKVKDADDRRRVIAIQREWKEVGRINKWRYLKLWKKYKREVDIFFGNNEDDKSSGQQRSRSQDDTSRPSGAKQNRRRRRMGETKRVFSTKKVEANTPKEVLERKEQLCQEVEEMLESNVHNVSLDAVKERQMEWRGLGMIQNDEEDKALNIRFRSTCNEIFEHYNLYKTVRNRVDEFSQKTSFEQLKIKIKTLKEAIRQEENELSRMTPPSPHNRDPRDKSRLKYINKVNKVKTQKRMLRKMQRDLSSDFY